jgi:O-acetyl-ADP-ribose deacetylase (regulator of RNase III)
MNMTIFAGDITEALAEAICTSTNPRLSLMKGTGGAVRERGGFAVLRACEAIMEREGELRPGSAHVTTTGALPYKAAIHCVASGAGHLSSAEIIRACLHSALAAADREEIAPLAMPVFATGHAPFRFKEALAAMGEALRSASTGVGEVIVVVDEADRVEEAERALGLR